MITEARKLCRKCGEERPLSGFYRSSRYSDGRQQWCKSCSLAAVKAFQKREGRSIVHRAVKYGLSKDEVRRMMHIPVCQACGADFTDSYSMKFDHCHEVGHFRGVLCHACNVACAGTSASTIVRLLGCINYLRRDLERSGEQG